MILDTNFLIDIDNNIPSALGKARELEKKGRPRRVPRVVVYELWTAVGKGTQTEQNRKKYERLLQGLPQVDLTLPIAKRAGEIEGQAQASDPNDSGVGAADAIIAATALVLDEPVVTDDRRDFANRMQNDLSLNDLRVEVYT
jgi:predicted nucleic acid-binding protein